MKKKIIIGAFSLLIIITAIAFISMAIDSYNYDMDPKNGVDILEGFGAVLIAVFGGAVVFYEVDLFYITYCFFVKPRTKIKSLLNIISNLALLLTFFTNTISHFLFEYVSEIFSEETIIFFVLFFMYVVLRSVGLIVSSSFVEQSSQK